MKRLVACALLLAAAFGAAAQSTVQAPDEGAERERIRTERAAVEARFAQEQRACRAKFAVNDCEAKARRVRNEGRVVSRAMLLQHVWDLHFDPSTNIIDVYVGRVWRKVDDQQDYPLIHTVRGVGYRLRAPG